MAPKSVTEGVPKPGQCRNPPVNVNDFLGVLNIREFWLESTTKSA